MLKLQQFSNSYYKNRFFESQPLADFQKTDFSISSTEGAGNTKIGFIMIIAVEITMLWILSLRLALYKLR